MATKTLGVKINGDASGLRSAMAAAGAAVTKFGGKARLALGGAALAATGLMVALGGKAVASAAGFEYAMAEVEAATEASETEMDTLTQKAKELGRTSKFMMTDIAGAEKALGKSGYTAKQTAAAMDGVTAAAAASGEPLEQVAKRITNVVKGYGLAASETSRVADVFSEAARSSNVTIKGLSEGMKYLGPVAKDMGLTLEETTAMLGSLGDAGIQAGQAGRQLRTAFLDFQKMQAGQISTTASKAMKRLGVSTDVTDMKFMDLIVKLREAGATAGDFATIFTKRSATALVKMADDSEELEEMTNRLDESKGAADEMAKTKLDTLSGQFDILKGSIDNMFQSLGEKLLPKLQTFLEDVAIPIVNKMTKWIDKQGSLNDLFEKMSEFLGTDTMEDLKKAGENLAKFFTKVGEVLGPTLRKSLDVATSLFKTVVALLAGDWGGAGKNLKKTLENLAGTFGTLFEKIMEKTRLDKLVEGIRNAIRAIKLLLNKVPGIKFDVQFEDFTEKMQEDLTASFTTKEGLKGAKDIIDPGDIEELKNTFDMVNASEQKKLGMIKDLIGQAKEAVEQGEGTATELNKGIEGIANAFDWLDVTDLGGLVEITDTKTKRDWSRATKNMGALRGVLNSLETTIRRQGTQTIPLEGKEFANVLANQLQLPEGVIQPITNTENKYDFKLNQNVKVEQQGPDVEWILGKLQALRQEIEQGQGGW